MDTYKNMQKSAEEAANAEALEKEAQETTNARVEVLAKYAEAANGVLSEEYGDDYTEEDVVKLASYLIDRDIEALTNMFEGILTMPKLPQAVVVVDPKKESIAIDEATQKGITTFALASSDCDISSITYPIPANDSARKSIAYFMKELAEAYTEGKKSPRTPETKKK